MSGTCTLTQIVGRLCKGAGLERFRSNHSLRATAASRLYDKKFDEQLICETTGHRSKAVRSYKRTNEVQKMDISNALQTTGETPQVKK
jgi:integrase